MRYRMLGQTGLRVSEIGFGTIPILSGNVHVLPSYYSPDDETALSIMHHAYQLGCNLYDTAITGEYGDAERKLGLFARQIDRSTIVIADKARRYSGEGIYRAVLGSVENLGTTPDIYFVHQVDEKNQEETFGPYGALDALCDLKREGIIRFTGIASHYFSVLRRAAMDERVDVLQGCGNILERGMLDRIHADPVFHGKAFLLNKVYAAGVLIPSFSPEELIGGILNHPFSSALIGIGTHEQVDAAMATDYPGVDVDFGEVIARLGKDFHPIPCDRCQQCVCPQGHEVHMLFREYNYSFLGKKEWAEAKMAMNLQKIYNSCLQCDSWACMNHCQRNICIPSQVERIWESMK